MAFENFPRSKCQVVSPEGEVRSETEAVFTAKVIVIFDENVVVLAGDEIRRTLPNGTDEAFEVIRANFYPKMIAIPAHFQIQYQPKGTFPHRQGGNFHINIHGHNARVNVGSTDNSTNTVAEHPVFQELIQAIEAGVKDGTSAALIDHVAQMRAAQGTGGFSAAYKAFMESAANHVAVIAPFLPALATLL